MKILVICGSRRDISLTRRLTDIAYEYAKGKYEDVKYLDLGKVEIEQFRGYTKDVQYTPETLRIVKMVEESDVFIIGSPAYNGSMSSAVKNLFEFVNYDAKVLEGKVAGIMVKGGSPGTWQQARSHIVAMMHFFVVICNPRAVFASNADFDENRELKNHLVREKIERLVDETVQIKGWKSS